MKIILHCDFGDGIHGTGFVDVGEIEWLPHDARHAGKIPKDRLPWRVYEIQLDNEAGNLRQCGDEVRLVWLKRPIPLADIRDFLQSG